MMLFLLISFSCISCCVSLTVSICFCICSTSLALVFSCRSSCFVTSSLFFVTTSAHFFSCSLTVDINVWSTVSDMLLLTALTSFWTSCNCFDTRSISPRRSSLNFFTLFSILSVSFMTSSLCLLNESSIVCILSWIFLSCLIIWLAPALQPIQYQCIWSFLLIVSYTSFAISTHTGCDHFSQISHCIPSLPTILLHTPQSSSFFSFLDIFGWVDTP